VRLNFGLVPRTQRSASLAMRSIVQFGGALQSRGPMQQRAVRPPGFRLCTPLRYACPGHERWAISCRSLPPTRLKLQPARAGSLDRL